MSHHHEHEVALEQGSNKKTLKSYVVGMILCIVLTFAAFGLVEKRLLTDAQLYISLTVLAIAQFFVQSVCFLRLNSSKEGRWNLMPFLFTIFIIAILVGGSLWIMYNLDYNMMN